MKRDEKRVKSEKKEAEIERKKNKSERRYNLRLSVVNQPPSLSFGLGLLAVDCVCC